MRGRSAVNGALSITIHFVALGTSSSAMATIMQKAFVLAIAIVAALSIAGCAGKGKTPVGKGKTPAVVTRG
jgi:hypothetical protein